MEDVYDDYSQDIKSEVREEKMDGLEEGEEGNDSDVEDDAPVPELRDPNQVSDSSTPEPTASLGTSSSLRHSNFGRTKRSSCSQAGCRSSFTSQHHFNSDFSSSGVHFRS